VLQGRPLYDNRADAALYVTPPEWAPIVRAIARNLNVLLVGGRGVGKTTLLRQVQFTLRGSSERVPAFVDGTVTGDPMKLASRIRDALVGCPGLVRSDAFTNPMAALAGDPTPPAAGVSRAYYALLQSLGEAPAATVLLDASSSADAVYGVFGRMRDTMWQLPHTWVVAIDEDDRASALKPPADAFFDTVVTLKPTSTNALADLLARRTPEASSSTLARVAALAHGNPRVALRALGNAEVNDSDPAVGLTARALLLDRASSLGRPYGMLMAELLDRGQASPSDDALQRTLGLTRPRLTTLLRDLLEQRLVVAHVEKPEGPGRPRTVYRPALDA